MAMTYTDVMDASDFEILDNESVLLRNGGSQSITLVGLDNGLNGITAAEAAYENVSAGSYVIAVCHTPDSAGKVPGDLTDYFLAGHSHGGQAYFFFTAEYTPPKATEYLRGKHNVNGRFILDITNGTGTTGRDVRFLSDAEIVLYRLHSSAAVQPPQETSSAETDEPEETPEVSPGDSAGETGEESTEETQEETTEDTGEENEG
jgi:predicted MPP superfamily phosphohydrolase